jgi:hypothetical protein
MIMILSACAGNSAPFLPDLTAGIIRFFQNGRIRATHSDFFKDTEELHYGLKFFRRIVEKLDEKYNRTGTSRYLTWVYFSSVTALKEYYIASFSTLFNNHYLWTSFADNGEGYMLVFNKDKWKRLGEWKICSYGTEELEEWFDFQNLYPKISQSIENHPIFLKEIFEKCLCFKREEYINEREYRFIMNNTGISPTLSRKRDGCLVPYREIKFNISDIEEIWVGPNNPDPIGARKVLDTMRHKLKMTFDIKCSSITYKE